MVIAAVVFAALAAVLVFIALRNSNDSSSSSSAASQDVVVATQDIGVNTKITADMVQVKSLASDQVINGAYATTAGLIGLPARYPIAQGEQVTSTKIGASKIKDEKDLSLVLPPGTRGFSIKASEVSAVGGLLLPNNSVDVIAVYDDPASGDKNNKKASTVLQNVTILSVAQVAQEPVPAASDTSATPGASQGISGERPSDVKAQPGAKSITLAVTPEQAQLLAALQSQDGVSLWVSLRPSDDTNSVALNDTTLQQLFGR